jgi:hypothetical protein
MGTTSNTTTVLENDHEEATTNDTTYSHRIDQEKYATSLSAAASGQSKVYYDLDECCVDHAEAASMERRSAGPTIPNVWTGQQYGRTDAAADGTRAVNAQLPFIVHTFDADHDIDAAESTTGLMNVRLMAMPHYVESSKIPISGPLHHVDDVSYSERKMNHIDNTPSVRDLSAVTGQEHTSSIEKSIAPKLTARTGQQYFDTRAVAERPRNSPTEHHGLPAHRFPLVLDKPTNTITNYGGTRDMDHHSEDATESTSEPPVRTIEAPHSRIMSKITVSGPRDDEYCDGDDDVSFRKKILRRRRRLRNQRCSIM